MQKNQNMFRICYYLEYEYELNFMKKDIDI